MSSHNRTERRGKLRSENEIHLMDLEALEQERRLLFMGYGLTILSMISAERKSQKMTLRELAERSGLSSQVVAKIENGYTDPSFERVVKMMKALGMTPNDLTQIWEDI